MASQQPAQQTARDHSGRRDHGRQRDRGDGVRSEPVPLGREFAAWLGMTPRQNSSGGKERLGRTSKRATNISAVCSSRGGRHSSTCAHARDEGRRMGARDAGAKAGEGSRGGARQPTARIVWAVMKRGDGYKAKEIVGQAA